MIQHDQIKDEVIKQNALPFLLECSKTLSQRALVLVYEVLWRLAFIEEIARVLRMDTEFLNRIREISVEHTDESLKKAVDGLIWKLIQGIVVS